MPIYEFVCTRCGDRAERLQGLADAPPACRACGTPGMRREISLIAGLVGGDRPAPQTAGCACGGACACGARA
ncbi:MAG: zinc ribbon domain-containing protein [Actinomycetota bacterium]